MGNASPVRGRFVVDSMRSAVAHSVHGPMSCAPRYSWLPPSPRSVRPGASAPAVEVEMRKVDPPDERHRFTSGALGRFVPQGTRQAPYLDDPSRRVSVRRRRPRLPSTICTRQLCSRRHHGRNGCRHAFASFHRVVRRDLRHLLGGPRPSMDAACSFPIGALVVIVSANAWSPCGGAACRGSLRGGAGSSGNTSAEA
jgi:hypothetical protein